MKTVTTHKTRVHYRKGQGAPKGWNRDIVTLIGGGRLK